MKNTTLNIKKVAAATGVLLGAFVLSAFAADWAPAGCTPPGCNAPAPVNVGSTAQYKSGALAIGKSTLPQTGLNLDVSGVARLGALLVDGDVSVANGKTSTKYLQVGSTDSTQVGYVLTKTDAAGNTEWKPSSGSSSGLTTLGTSYCFAQGANRWRSFMGLDGYYLKTLIKSTDNDWDGYGGVYCHVSSAYSKTNPDPRMTDLMKTRLAMDSYGAVIPSSIGLSYTEIVEGCIANPALYGTHTVSCPVREAFILN